MKQKLTIHKLVLDIEIEIPDEPIDVREKTVALLNANPRRIIRDRLKALQSRVSANPGLEGVAEELAAIQREWFQDAKS